MARVLVESLMVRYPLAGMVSWTLQYLVGLHRLGHDVVLVERADHAYACFDPATGRSGRSCATGVSTVAEALARAGLDGRWCFVDDLGSHYGRTARDLDELFASADVFIAMTMGECWAERAATIPCRVLIDGDPVFRQSWHRRAAREGVAVPEYDAWFTTALDIAASNVPDDGRPWRPMLHPVATDLFRFSAPDPGAPFTTIMNWRSYDDVVEDGTRYGQKDVELARFLDLPQRSPHRLVAAIAGDAPLDVLGAAGWETVSAHEVTADRSRFHAFIEGSLGELSVCKHAYVASGSGWFSDRSAAYLASGRPVVLQETGFSRHLPCGSGLFAFRDHDEAVDAIERIRSEPRRHGAAARAIACEELEATKVMAGLMDRLP